MASYDEFDVKTHDPQYVKARWHAPAGSFGVIDVWVIAYSLGATRAFCILHIEEAQTGNYAMCWLPTAELQIIENTANKSLIEA